MDNNYQQQALEFLKETQTEFTYKRIGTTCPPWNECSLRNHMHGNHYLITLTRNGKAESFDFWNSFNDTHPEIVLRKNLKYEDENKERNLRFKNGRDNHKVVIHAYDFLACVNLEDYSDFTEFCDAFGCNNDSIKDKHTWERIQECNGKLRRLSSTSQLEKLQEIA